MVSHLSLCQLHLVCHKNPYLIHYYSTFYNDMPDCAEHSVLSLFADDAKCFRKINNVDDCERLQHDLNSLCAWS